MSARAAILEQRDLAVKVAACALLTALGARLAMPLPYTPVPVTWQVAGVLFAGLWLGPRGAFVSQALYVVMGAAGAPVFAHGSGGAAILIGPTGGYLLSYPFAAWTVGALAGAYSAGRKHVNSGQSTRDGGAWLRFAIPTAYSRLSPLASRLNVIRLFLACMAGIAVIYALGCLQLGLVAHLSPLQAVAQGAGAFLFWDLAKAVLVVGAFELKDRSSRSHGNPFEGRIRQP